MSFLYHEGLMRNDEGGEAVSGQEGSTEAAKTKMQIEIAADADFDGQQPVFFPPGEGGLSAVICCAAQHIGQDKIDEVYAEAKRKMDRSGSAGCWDRMQPKGGDDDTWEVGQWKPKKWDTPARRPTDLCGMGAPWIHV